MEDLFLELISPNGSDRDRYFERQCEGLQNDILSPVIVRTGRAVHDPKAQHLRHELTACLATQHREVQACLRLAPTERERTDAIDALAWTGPRVREVSALVINRCPFDNPDAQLEWRRNLISQLFTRLEPYWADTGTNRLLLLTERCHLPVLSDFTYPSKRIHAHRSAANQILFGFRISTLDQSPFAPPLPAHSNAILQEASSPLSNW
ncbi:MAG: hypothetical protein AAFY73_13390 [Pseudomonadota bacterium]